MLLISKRLYQKLETTDYPGQMERLQTLRQDAAVDADNSNDWGGHHSSAAAFQLDRTSLYSAGLPNMSTLLPPLFRPSDSKPLGHTLMPPGGATRSLPPASRLTAMGVGFRQFNSAVGSVEAFASPGVGTGFAYGAGAGGGGSGGVPVGGDSLQEVTASRRAALLLSQAQPPCASTFSSLSAAVVGSFTQQEWLSVYDAMLAGCVEAVVDLSPAVTPPSASAGVRRWLHWLASEVNPAMQGLLTQPAAASTASPVAMDVTLNVNLVNVVMLGCSASSDQSRTGQSLAVGEEWVEYVEVGHVALSNPAVTTGCSIRKPRADGPLEISCCVSSGKVDIIVTPEVFRTLMLAEVRSVAYCKIQPAPSSLPP
jgi:hypothetical protein